MEFITNFLRHSNYYSNGSLCNNPVGTGREPTCIGLFPFADGLPEYSIVMPIHNQAAIIKRNLKSILKHTVMPYELILILDACEDETEENVMSFCRGARAFFLQRITVVRSVTPLFEASCDNIGFRLAQGRYLLEIQADMLMTEPDYNLTLTKPFLKYNELIGVSGRCCHSLDSKYIIGRGDHAINLSVEELGINRNWFYVHETCNRGPLLLDREKVAALGYLDEQNFVLDSSEHDLFMRARERGWLCGYVPINFLSPAEDGSTRKPRNAINVEFLAMRRARSNGGYLDKFMKTYSRSEPYKLALE
jgi:glycosyltransferase involved in cell wall biosynthesis